LAGMKKWVEQNQVVDQELLAIVSGANTNFDRLRYISERTEIGEKREAVISVTIPEKAGSFRSFCHALGKRSVTEFNYRFSDTKLARIFVGLQIVPGGDDLAQLLGQLRESGYEVEDLTDNEMAKLHIRHMVGGHAPLEVSNERVYRFQFPERPGALVKFLAGLGQRWNISMFHYRNHGAAYGRILVGIQVSPGDLKALEKVLKEINYPFWDETDNRAYQLYLGNNST